MDDANTAALSLLDEPARSVVASMHAKEPQPGAGGAEFLDALNPDSKRIVRAYLEPGARNANAEDRYQFERHGYFVADRVDSKPGMPVFNRIVSLRDSWTKPA